MIRAAGGVVVDGHGRVALVHRPRHKDWSLPKGKLDDGESFEAAALREVREECGLRCELGDELPTSEYEVRGEPKVVRWWRMRVLEDLGFAIDDEVDSLEWLAPDAAVARLTYAPDRALVRLVGAS
jgi:8-oxo-dGTP diphosphatase